MAKKNTHVLNCVMVDDAKPMIKELKDAVRTSRREIGLYMALKFITTSKERMNAFKRYSQSNVRTINRVSDLIRKHEKGK